MAQESELVGSDAWTGGEIYVVEEFVARIQYFKTAFNEAALLAHASSIRNGIKCRLHDKFAVGNFNFVKKIAFDDGVDWVARLRLPPIEHFDENGLMEELPSEDMDIDRVLYEMQSELDTMEFVR